MILVKILAVWFGLSLMLAVLLAIRGRHRPFAYPVELKEAPGGLQGPRSLP